MRGTAGGAPPRKTTVAVLAFTAAFLLVERATADVICLFKSEQISGTNKICYYDCLGSIFAITIDGLKLCPLNIRR
jgi:hypothetical protein